MTFDAMLNSPSHSQLNTEIWKENLVIYHKSLKAFLQAPLHLLNRPDNRYKLLTLLYVKTL